mgnify:CR=1 FL=1
MNLRSNRYYPSGADHQSTVAEIFGNNVDAKFSPVIFKNVEFLFV